MPVFAAIPGMKLGLTNIVILFAIYLLDVKAALLINVIRIILVGLTFGTAVSFWFSLSGGVLSTLVMILIFKKTSLSKISTSVAGGIMHNAGQLMVAMILFNTSSVAWYFVVLWFSGIIFGIITGYLSGILIGRLSGIINKI